MSRRQVGVDIDGMHFDSKAEFNRYNELKLMQRAGEISQLKCQPSYVLLKQFSIRKRKVRGMTYTPDFRYIKNGKVHVEDVKGHATEAYRIKKKLFLSYYGQEIIFVESRQAGKTFSEKVY